MNLALFGYGKMGKAIEQMALKKGHEIVLKVGKEDKLENIELDNLAIDVAIEFSTPAAAFSNIKFCLENKLAVISGTTGWLDKLPEIDKLTKNLDGTFFYASNFSLGVNLFFKLNKHLAKLLAAYGYSPEIEETHHIHKKDAPSGTAITLAEGIIANTPWLSKWTDSGESSRDSLPISSIRKEDVPGTHKIIYEGQNDSIIIEHKAHNRLGFAGGAVAVAEWIKGKKGVLTMDDFLG